MPKLCSIYSRILLHQLQRMLQLQHGNFKCEGRTGRADEEVEGAGSDEWEDAGGVRGGEPWDGCG